MTRAFTAIWWLQQDRWNPGWDYDKFRLSSPRRPPWGHLRIPCQM